MVLSKQGGVALASLLIGCSGAEWRQIEIEDGYQPPQAVRVSVTAHRQLEEVRKVLETTLLDSLDSDGIPANAVSSSSGQADVSVTVRKWEPGDRGLRWLCSCAGEAEVLVEMTSPGIDGDARGYVAGGWFGGDAHDSAIAAAELIAETIVKGQRALSTDPSHGGSTAPR